MTRTIFFKSFCGKKEEDIIGLIVCYELFSTQVKLNWQYIMDIIIIIIIIIHFFIKKF